MTIVSTDYRPKRARKRKQSPPIPQRIVSAKQPKPARAVVNGLAAGDSGTPRVSPSAASGGGEGPKNVVTKSRVLAGAG